MLFLQHKPYLGSVSDDQIVQRHCFLQSYSKSSNWKAGPNTDCHWKAALKQMAQYDRHTIATCKHSTNWTERLSLTFYFLCRYLEICSPTAHEKRASLLLKHDFCYVTLAITSRWQRSVSNVTFPTSRFQRHVANVSFQRHVSNFKLPTSRFQRHVSNVTLPTSLSNVTFPTSRFQRHVANITFQRYVSNVTLPTSRFQRHVSNVTFPMSRFQPTTLF